MCFAEKVQRYYVLKQLVQIVATRLLKGFCLLQASVCKQKGLEGSRCHELYLKLFSRIKSEKR
jgi:hypothetical protein